MSIIAFGITCSSLDDVVVVVVVERQNKRFRIL